MHQKQYKNFNIIVIASVMSLLIATTLFNLVIDPYNIYKVTDIKNFNNYKPVVANNLRVSKYYEAKKLQPEVIFIGNSRVLLGINPETFMKKTGKTVYNFGIHSLAVDEMEKLIQVQIKNNKNLKTIYLAIDEDVVISRLNQLKPKKDIERLESSFYTTKDLLDTLVSYKSTQESYNTIKFNQKPAFNDYYYYKNTGLNKVLKSFNNLNSKKIFKEYFSLRHNQDVSMEEETIKGLEKLKGIKALCAQNNIELVVFTNPVHSHLLMIYEKFCDFYNYESLKRKLVEITDFYDFGTISEITNQKISNDIEYMDLSHYRDSIGDKMISVMLGEKNDIENFGILVTTGNIEEHLAMQKKINQSWINKNPEIFKELRQTKLEMEE